jgi:hypothetical protein
MSSLRLSQKDGRRVKRALRELRPCLLCETFPPAYQAVFETDHPEPWGGTSGKRRLFVYALCARCEARPDVTLHVEARIMAPLVGRGN